MTSLSQYLMEARQLVGNLPFTYNEFVEYLQVANDYTETEPAYIRMKDIITSNYGEKVWSSFRGWTFRAIHTTDPEELYKSLAKMPVERLSRLLGSGAFGVGIDSKDKIIKWLHVGNEFEEDEKVFYQYCRDHNSKYFPKVYKFTDRYVVMEKVKPGTSKCKEWVKLSRTPIKQPFSLSGLWGRKRETITLAKLAELVADGTMDKSKANKLTKGLGPSGIEFFEWYIGAIAEAIQNKFYPEDFAPSNIGERKDGSIVWFDI